MPSSRSARAPNARRFGGRAVASRLAVLSARCGPRVDGCAVATPQHSAACGSADCCSSSLVAWRRMSPCAATGARSGLAEHCCRLTVRHTSPGVQRGTKLNGTAVLRCHPSIPPLRPLHLSSRLAATVSLACPSPRAFRPPPCARLRLALLRAAGRSCRSPLYASHPCASSGTWGCGLIRELGEGSGQRVRVRRVHRAAHATGHARAGSSGVCVPSLLAAVAL